MRASSIKDSVHPEMLLKVLARVLVAAKITTVVRHFHDGMQARVSTDDCSPSE